LCFHTRIPADPADVYHDEEHLAYPMDEAFEEHYRYRVERFGRERVRLLQKYCGDLSDKKILDVGCGNGYCLMALKETGAQCFGSEFSKKWRSFAMEKTGVTVYEEPLEHFPQRDFDVLTLFDVIEHIEKPVPFMEAAGRLLKPGGRVLIYTPNFDSFSIRVMGKYSNHISPHGHLIFFNRKALDYLGHKTGFRIVHSETRGLDVHSILSYQEYQGEQRDPFLVRWGDEIQAMIDASGSGDYIRIIYEKTN
jgi:2-polyprenyl-3-methyl-5-hydroxy-6-metoxy-1,4-benzoquinol methylase